MEEGSDKIYIVDQRHSTNANPEITAGIQIDGTTATMVCGSPTLSNVAGADASPADNHYYSLSMGVKMQMIWLVYLLIHSLI